MTDYMFDTEVFNKILDNSTDLALLQSLDNKYHVTHIQRDELQATKDRGRREKLLEIFFDVVDIKTPTESAVIGISRVGEARIGGDNIVATESAVWGVSSWGQCKWTANDNLYSPIKDALDMIKKKKSNIQDALIAETSIKNGFILVANDKALNIIVPKYGGQIMSFEKFMALIRK